MKNRIDYIKSLLSQGGVLHVFETVSWFWDGSYTTRFVSLDGKRYHITAEELQELSKTEKLYRLTDMESITSLEIGR